MTVPAAQPIRIFVDNVDVTGYTDYHDCKFEDLIHDVSKFAFTLYNPPFVPTEYMAVQVIENLDPWPTLFIGYIILLDKAKHDNGIAPEYEIEAGDRKIRLQKAILPPFEYDGSDVDIITDMFDDSYPDLTDLFNLSVLENLADDLELDVNDDSLLDMLADLADKAGANLSHENGASTGSIVTFGFDPDVDIISYGGTTSDVDGQWWSDEGLGIDGAGNGGGWGFREDGLTPAAPSAKLIEFNFNVRSGLGNDVTATGVSFDYLIDCPLDTTTHTYVASMISAQTGVHIIDAGVGVNDGNWHNVSASLSAEGNIFTLFIRLEAPLDSPYVVRFDNIVIEFEEVVSAGVEPNVVKWQAEPDSAPFDIDVDLSDEFAFDIHLELGSFDGFNSVTVIGGAEDIGIDWVYESLGYLDHFNLEKQVKDLVVYRNTGTDGTPNWVLQDLGTWGVDELGVAGIDVLYDPETAWLYFDSEPSNLGKAIRITGTIKKPIRVRVENVAEGEIVLATTIYSDSVKTAEEAAILGYAALNKRRLRALSFKTLHPGLRVGQAMRVIDASQALDETAIISRIYTEWIGASGHAEFTVDCGDNEGDGIDTMIAYNDKRSREKAPPVPVATVAVVFLTDDSGNPLTDESDRWLYTLAEA